jgi:3-oxoacyl-[acyl-carrier protein] reductase
MTQLDDAARNISPHEGTKGAHRTASGSLPVALVTGGSAGIGRACAFALAATHEVWLTYNRGRPAAESIVDTIRSRGGRAHMLPLDASDPAAIESLYEEFVRGAMQSGQTPRLDALIANGAVFGDAYRFLFDIEEDEWDRVWATNTTGVIRLVRLFLELLLPGGAIVHTSTMSVPVGAVSYKSHAHYTTSKAATTAFLDGIAANYASRGLRCVNIVTGLIDTRMLRDNFGDDLTSYLTHIPLGRVGTPEEMASLIARLVSAPALPIGRIAVDGGWLQKGWCRI